MVGCVHSKFVGHLAIEEPGHAGAVQSAGQRVVVRDVDGQFDFSVAGTFVNASGRSMSQKWQVVWLDGTGKTQSLIFTRSTYRVSESGRESDTFTAKLNDITP
jgi:hypothetical protein